MIGPLDEYPIHQAPLPINRPASSDRNFYDRCYFNGMDTLGGDTMLITETSALQDGDLLHLLTTRADVEHVAQVLAAEPPK